MAANPYYFVLAAPDPELSLTFFGGLFGWAPRTGMSPRGWNIDNTAFPGAVIASDQEPRATLYFNVPNEADVAHRAELITSLGGSCDELQDSPTGVSIRCVDNQGTHFAMGWERPEFVADWDQPAAREMGELGFVSLPAADANVAVDFYSRVMDWEFDTPDEAHEAGGFRHTGSPNPTVGIHPKNDLTVPTLYFLVPDVAHAVEQVVSRGGSSSPAHTAESGTSADCRCNQGTPFSLWTPAPGYS